MAAGAFSGRTIGFRADASLAIGTGHVMRCLALADALAEHGARCRFASRLHEGHLHDTVRRRGHAVLALAAQPTGAPPPSASQRALAHARWLGCSQQADARAMRAALGEEVLDWLIVDHYAIDAEWERALRPACRRMLVIDDLADRAHDCEVLLDQNLRRRAEDYAALVPQGSAVLTGPDYALLRPQFAARRSSSLARRRSAHGALRRLLISLGGIDRDDVTGAVLRALLDSPRALPAACEITVVMGSSAPWLDEVRSLAARLPWPIEVCVDVDDMASLMDESDLAIGAAGTTSWERCCLGLPTLLLVIAENQRRIADALEAAAAAITVDFRGTKNFSSAFHYALASVAQAATLVRMGEAAATIVDGRGADRVLGAMSDAVLR